MLNIAKLNTTNSMKEIAAYYNQIADVAVDTVRLSKLGKAKVLAKIAEIEAAKAAEVKEVKPVLAKNGKKKTVRTGITKHIRELLMKVVGTDENGRSIGLSYDEVLAEVVAADSRRQPSRNGIMWTACKMRSEGIVLPQIRPRKGKY
jgi:hypothetical protein|nr:MAG TPA: hypothetical protein [Ackermannviridae sp.]